jgi:urate oxidase
VRSVPEVSSIFFNLPNLHFLPCTPVTSKFEHDVYVATSEPHGNIEAVVTRGQTVQPHCKL